MQPFHHLVIIFLAALYVFELKPIRRETALHAQGAPTTESTSRTVLLADILVAVSYSHPFYSSIPFIRWLYQHFGHVYFCGDPQNGPLPALVHSVNVTAGWHQHRCLMNAMQEYPDYKGYIGANDDLVLHPWYIATWDFDKCWIEKCKRFTPLMLPGLLRNEYIPGDVEIDHLGDEIEYGKPALRKVHDSLPQTFKERLSLYTGGTDVYCEGDDDFVYVPAIYRQQFLEIAAIFDSSSVGFPWLYSATTYGVCQEKNVLHPNGVWLWGAQRKSKITDVYSSNVPLIHPVKFSDHQSRQVVHDVFASHFGVTYPHKTLVATFPDRPFIPPPLEPPCTYMGSPNSSCPPAYD